MMITTQLYFKNVITLFMLASLSMFVGSAFARIQFLKVNTLSSRVDKITENAAGVIEAILCAINFLWRQNIFGGVFHC